MLKSIVKHWRLALLLLALWLVFESVISWFAFCEQAKNDGGYYQAAPKDSCIFRGPFVSSLGAFSAWWHHKFEEPDSYVALFTGVLVVATVALWWSTRNLWRATLEADKTRARETQILQRAYISVEPGGISESSSIAKCHPNIFIRNVGNLPARDVCWFIDWAVDHDHRRAAFALDLDKLDGEVTLTPGAVMQQGGPIIYVGDGPGELRAEVGLYLYVWGMVRYDNGFGETRRTQFCHRYNAVNLEQLFHPGPTYPDGRTGLGIIRGHKIDVEDARVHRYGNDAS